ncbi:MAG: DUF1080 domain-containing protein [Verrucomicrobia bacterium]|nr:DUF1080 domain-containing protein [Verrucomicrobiota bacterium]
MSLFLAFPAAAADPAPATPAKPAANAPPAASPPAGGDGSKGGGLGGIFNSVKDAVGLGAPAPVHLFNGKRLDDNFYTWIKKSGVYVDPDKVFSVKDGELRISGKHEGYLATKSQFADFRLVAEYRWGAAKWPPRENKPRNSGIIVAATGEDKEWMKGIECQIAEGATGDVVLHGGAQMTVGREAKSKAWAEFPRATTNEVENAHGKWNTLEVVCEGGNVRVRVNGHVTVEGFGASPNSGKILLQSNGSEIFFRKLDIFPLNLNSVTAPGGK